MNVRIPLSLRDRLDARRQQLAARPENGGHFSRDRWVENVIKNALDSRGAGMGTAPGVRTATPPHRRSS